MRQVRTGVLCIPFSGSLHGPTDRAAFGLIEAFRRRTCPAAALFADPSFGGVPLR